MKLDRLREGEVVHLSWLNIFYLPNLKSSLCVETFCASVLELLRIGLWGDPSLCLSIQERIKGHGMTKTILLFIKFIDVLFHWYSRLI